MRLAATIVGLLLLSAWPIEAPAQSGPASAESSRERGGSLALTPPSQKARAVEPGKPIAPQSPLTLVIGLTVVLGVFFVVVWLLRRTMPGGHGLLPAEAFAVLGRAPLANRQQVQLIRCGNKLLLVCVSGVGAETLTEITDPSEVQRLVDACGASRNRVVSAAQAAPGSENRDAG
ncbi:MAG: flagellar biosynthetic protein FliO [Thermoguttaceae bacterium]